ncbi:hypothetical protein G1C98_1205 [Bifidobacterium sp. DSM 109960]|uniref:DUF4190 domain-containing protein n=1 Tax=Bifidobacterium erythrocebi TaxID=2675325 RepID=A0A7Y0HW26_9BIFI|nr:DUF4190 domain-containing protein [Bifidobacterium sp. DSM 109960]NMM96469.1 hypothetical protein [Bifidobacterium sp. DSM 109960]
MDDHKQPEYGQTKQPQYGAMSGQYPGYDPYLYGKPEPAQPADGANAAQQNPANGQQPGAQPYFGQNGQNTQNGQQYAGQQGQPYNPYAQPNPYAQQQNQYNPYGGQPPQPNMPRIQYLNPDDPAQNPFYGHWDSYAIVAFVCSLVFSVPVLPAVIGGLSLVRTKRLHMKGRGLAIAAIVINVLTTLLQAYLLIRGISVNDLYAQMFNMYSGGGNGGGAGDGSISA